MIRRRRNVFRGQWLQMQSPVSQDPVQPFRTRAVSARTGLDTRRLILLLFDTIAHFICLPFPSVPVVPPLPVRPQPPLIGFGSRLVLRHRAGSFASILSCPKVRISCTSRSGSCWLSLFVIRSSFSFLLFSSWFNRRPRLHKCIQINVYPEGNVSITS